MIKEAIVKIVNKQDLTYEEAYEVMNEIMSGKTTSTQNAAFLAALSTKSARAETTDEIAGCAAAMREHAIQVDTNMELFEIVGTGGDNAQSFNISTTAALVAAAGGMNRHPLRPVVERRRPRKSCGVFEMRNCRLSGSTRGSNSAKSGEMQGTVGRSGNVFLFCAEISYLHEICGIHSKRIGISDSI